MLSPALSHAVGRRRIILTAVILGTIPAFAFTNALNGSARQRRQELANGWAQQGQGDLAASRPTEAANDFRTAQEYARNRGEYRLQLAEALIAGNHIVEAQSQLLTLWTQTPGDGTVNRELARIAARRDDVPEAMRYYHGAIDGAWDGPAAVQRRKTRSELAEFLLRRGDKTQAQAELIALVADLPSDPAAMTDAAALLLEADADPEALTLLQKALELDPHDGRALRLAGEAAFAAGDYRTARSHLEAAGDALHLDARGQELLDLSTRVLTLDPFARRISSRERLRRVVRVFGAAQQALARCPAGSHGDLQSQMDALEPKMTERTLAGDPDLVDEAIALVTTVDGVTSAACGTPTGDPLALQLVLRQRRAAS